MRVASLTIEMLLPSCDRQRLPPWTKRIFPDRKLRSRCISAESCVLSQGPQWCSFRRADRKLSSSEGLEEAASRCQPGALTLGSLVLARVPRALQALRTLRAAHSPRSARPPLAAPHRTGQSTGIRAPHTSAVTTIRNMQKRKKKERDDYANVAVPSYDLANCGSTTVRRRAQEKERGDGAARSFGGFIDGILCGPSLPTCPPQLPYFPTFSYVWVGRKSD